jgi:hypothetical protein
VIHAFLEFCYIAQQDAITDNTLKELKDALAHFQDYWLVFKEEGV